MAPCGTKLVTGEPFHYGVQRRKSVTQFFGKCVSLIDGRYKYKGKSLKMFLHDKEKEFLQRTIESVNGDKEKAANELGISLATLYRKLPSDLKK
jgi:transcriptional regulator with PAS, ATPase and Fis domain